MTNLINFLPQNRKIKQIRIYNYLAVIMIFAVISGVFLLPKIIKSAGDNDKLLIDYTNEQRAEAGLKPLVENKLLNLAAQNKAIDIFRYQEFDHKIAERKFSQWVKETGYQYKIVGENLAIDFINNKNVIAAWLKSTEHKNNLLNQDYSEIGVASVVGEIEGKRTRVVVQIFALPMLDKEKLAFTK